MDKLGFFINNILVIGESNGKNGEYRNSKNLKKKSHEIICNDNTVDRGRITRILKQIVVMGQCAVKVHKAQSLTQVVTDEFSFYTKNTPLSIKEYKKLINELAKSMKNLPPNIVLVASSMAVLWPDNCIRNAVLHIQSPNGKNLEPIIHHFSKETFSSQDPMYSKDNTTRNCYTFKPDDYSSAEFSPDVVLADTKMRCLDPQQYKSAIIVRGHKIPPILHVIDVCLDHANGVGMKNARILLEKIVKPPLHISHIITSNWIDIRQEKLVASAISANWNSKRVDGVYEEKSEPIMSFFGKTSHAYYYSKKRAEILYTRLFDIVRKKIATPIAHICDKNGNTLLHEVLLFEIKNTKQRGNHRKKRVDTLLRHFDSTTINQQNAAGDTPLHLAIEAVKDENTLLKFLVHGANLTIKNKKGLSPLGVIYKTQKNSLITTFCNKLMNNRKAYIPQRFAIFTLLSEIQETPIKRKMINAALSFELSENRPVEKIIVGLLKRAYNPNQLIINHQLKLFSLGSYMPSLKRYLINQQLYAVQKRTPSLPILFKPINQKMGILQSTRKHKWIDKEVSHQQNTENKDTLLQSVSIKTATLSGLKSPTLAFTAALTGLGLFAYGTCNNRQSVNSGTLLHPNGLTPKYKGGS
ncbi:ankyrin repeat domain-containing protein [Legionella sainthelensi]|uniref:ankyrin repeat domain-containing protein n=1 Tax=Legionella sainthelensi TaxID=28087 RepID=UPI000E1FDB7C|nr:ankyrin repeat domain-containing protein [Legionella sainthelensi]